MQWTLKIIIFLMTQINDNIGSKYIINNNLVNVVIYLGRFIRKLTKNKAGKNINTRRSIQYYAVKTTSQINKKTFNIYSKKVA